MRSLATKLSVCLALLFIVALVIVGAIATRNSVRDQRMMLQSVRQLSTSRAAADVRRFVERTGSLRGVQSVLASDAQREGRGLLLLDAHGKLVASSDPTLVQAKFARSASGFVTLGLRYERAGSVGFEQLMLSQPLGVVRLPGGTVAQIYPLPHPLSSPSPVATNRRFLAALAIVGALTLLCGYLLAQYFLDPIRKLTRAAERLRQGSYEKLNLKRDDELGDLADTFDALTTELERSTRQRRDLIADIAHELRSPLTNIRCAIEEMQDMKAPVSASNLKSVHDDVLQLQHLIADLHDLSMADARALHLRIQPLDLKAAVETSLQAFSPQLLSKQVQLTSNFPNSDVVVSADGARVRQIIGNFLANAIRATPVSGRIGIDVARLDRCARVSVEDSGPGFRTENAERLFERFFREEPSRSRETGGSGLGLAVCRQIVVAHGGKIWAEQRNGGGARFSFTLPLANL
ncbi:MAG: HAMP domain-containing protein [Candidatus Eremiobacteraeota bacterium]|nr:HAMP domain-containing protein [Candidatus Eremiobacteraeota bacterium]